MESRNSNPARANPGDGERKRVGGRYPDPYALESLGYATGGCSLELRWRESIPLDKTRLRNSLGSKDRGDVSRKGKQHGILADQDKSGWDGENTSSRPAHLTEKPMNTINPQTFEEQDVIFENGEVTLALNDGKLWLIQSGIAVVIEQDTLYKMTVAFRTAMINRKLGA